MMLPTGFSDVSGGVEMASADPFVTKISPIKLTRIQSDNPDPDKPIFSPEKF